MAASRFSAVLPLRRALGMATASYFTSDKLLSTGTKIIVVARNYAAHAKELGNAVLKEPVFIKPTSSYLQNGGTIQIPPPLESLDHEVELAIVIGKKARDVDEAYAMDYVGGYALALDMTTREIQSTAKAAGLPWTVAKGQDTFTPISQYLPKPMVADPDNLDLWLKVDDVVRQKGSTRDMIFKIPFLVSHISSFMTLFEGDVILTGIDGTEENDMEMQQGSPGFGTTDGYYSFRNAFEATTARPEKESGESPFANIEYRFSRV